MIQNKISKLGYKWNSRLAKYEGTGDLYKVENDSILFADLFNKKPLKQATTISNSTKTVESKSQLDNKKKSVAFENSTDSKKSTDDSIDSILFGKKKSSRVQRAYYLDKELAAIIDKIEGKQKSNLVNECIRKVFEEKGILKKSN